MTGLIALTLVAAVVGGCGGQQPAAEGSPQAEGPQEVAVTAVEYAFEGVPASVPAGETTFRMRNEGDEPHMMFFVSIEGTSKSVEELMELSDKASDRFVEEVGGMRKPVGPAETGDVTIELAPGRYAYVCFVAGPDGEAHYENGMFGELGVA